ncbi:MAG: hypothetical protein A2086_04875 [Spirochaetes bacterium GWD1_27_9]|nr:MAG: hypothetical protein A2Z98_04290 [Spirochaetes bacterium GWB1_27_13]OHD27639.1 MAG: hypothetical protein A2Y34_00330 [Spirochaetes bacterium GWC1_27_15]OHD31949.1 MAG: hypothetical protein A2086_04875 [Spirochaetes bacterium GWD1_27_9]
MDYFIWDKNYNTNIEKIDEQHEILLSMMNSLHNGLKLSDTHLNKIVANVINDLFDYISYHFKTEEDLMEKSNYPYYEEHKNEHSVFFKKMLEIQKEFSKGKLNIEKELLDFLKDWLIKHILATDKKLGNFLLEKGNNNENE